MPRKPRDFVDGGIYHVFNRGNNRRDLFRCEEDFDYFLKLVRSAQEKYRITIFHYCLMTNHFHILLRSEIKEDLPAFMHWLQLGYNRYFKKKYDTIGHIFQERFRSPRISEESYYLQCGRYIERNPIKAGMVLNAWDYCYSSARYYAFGEKDKLITTNPYYLEMGLSDEERRESYKRFLALEEPYTPMIDQQLVSY